MCMDADASCGAHQFLARQTATVVCSINDLWYDLYRYLALGVIYEQNRKKSGSSISRHSENVRTNQEHRVMHHYFASMLTLASINGQLFFGFSGNYTGRNAREVSKVCHYKWFIRWKPSWTDTGLGYGKPTDETWYEMHRIITMNHPISNASRHFFLFGQRDILAWTQLNGFSNSIALGMGNYKRNINYEIDWSFWTLNNASIT